MQRYRTCTDGEFAEVIDNKQEGLVIAQFLDDDWSDHIKVAETYCETMNMNGGDDMGEIIITDVRKSALIIVELLNEEKDYKEYSDEQKREFMSVLSDNIGDSISSAVYQEALDCEGVSK